MTRQIDAWKGDFGNQYTLRNHGGETRRIMWGRVLENIKPPASVLEVGCNVGLNLDILHAVLPRARLFGLEPNDKARTRVTTGVALDGTAGNIPLDDGQVEMAFTCGVLIHVPPEDLARACAEIYRVSSRYVVCIEYFADKPEEVLYRGEIGMLWKRDFGDFWMRQHPLKLLDYGFLWRRATGVDNLTYWVFEK